MGRGEVFDAASDEVFGVRFWQHHEFCFGCAVADDVAHDGEGGFVGDHEDGDAECCQGGGDIGDAERSVCLAYIGSVFKADRETGEKDHAAGSGECFKCFADRVVRQCF